ncbi:type II toxin-antitoxin system RelE/ParE family toxin [Pusillimonas sp.]|uniref:type II toxin-antitoxin system RelE/ParE family toxin n=1 Tax=Pusillimonas sp. TaxID=3040095 RepID=UPI0037C5272F
MASRAQGPESKGENNCSHAPSGQGNLGDVKPISDGVSEMRIHFGPGYHIYYAREGRAVYLLLIGGDKSTQKRDVKTAITMWKQIKEEQP